MRTLLVICGLVASAVLSGCADSEAETFGRSYDECILKNAREGGDYDSREMARGVCARRFTRAPTRAEIEQVQLGSTLRIDSDGIGPRSDDVRVSVTNNSRNFVVTEIETSVMFLNGPPTPGVKYGDEDVHSGLIWELFPATQPGETNSVLAGFDGGRAPTPYTVRRSRVKTILPFN